MYCLPPTIEDLATDGRDVLGECLPADMTFVTEKDGQEITVDYRARMIAEIELLYGVRPICYHNVDKWVRQFKIAFSPELLGEFGKRMGIYALNRELDVDYANYEQTTESESEDLPDTPAPGTYLSSRGKVKVTMKQPSGPLGSAVLLRDSQDAVQNPMVQFVRDLQAFFVPQSVVDYMDFQRCQYNEW